MNQNSSNDHDLSLSSNKTTHPQSVPHSYKYNDKNKKLHHHHHQLETVRVHLPIVSPSESSLRAPKNTKTNKIGDGLAPLLPHLKDSNENENNDNASATTDRRVTSSTTTTTASTSPSSCTPKASGKSTRIIKTPASLPCLRQKRRLFVSDSNSSSKSNFENDTHCGGRINNDSRSSSSNSISVSNKTLLHDYDGGDPSHSLNKRISPQGESACVNVNRKTNGKSNANDESLMKKNATEVTKEDKALVGVEARAHTSVIGAIRKNASISSTIIASSSSSSSLSSLSKYNAKIHYDPDEDEILQAAHILCQIKSDLSSSSSFMLSLSSYSSCHDSFHPFFFMPSLLSSSSLRTSSELYNAIPEKNYQKQKQYHYQQQQHQQQPEIYQDLTKPVDYPYPSRRNNVTNSRGHKRGRGTNSSLHHKSSLVFRSSSSSIKPRPKASSSSSSFNRRLSKSDIYDHIIHSEQRGRSASVSTGTTHSTVDDSDDARSISEDDNEEFSNEYDTHSNTTNEYSDKEDEDEDKENRENGNSIQNHHHHHNLGKKEKSLPNRLALPNDKLEVNSLHCYVRSDLLELFVVPSPDESDDTNQNHKRKKKKMNKNRDGPLAHTSTNRRHIPGRVGLRCVHCKHHQKKKKEPHRNQYTKLNSSSSLVDMTETAACDVDATKADFFPRSLQMLYREVCTWQRVHFQHCPHIPKSCRDHYKHLKESDKTRGKTKYWESSARELGLVNAFSASGDHDGIRFK